MNAQQIEKFIDAGYTKGEIELLFKNPKVDPEPEPETKPEPKKELLDNDPAATKSSQTKTENESNKNLDLKEMTDTIKTLTDTVTSLSETVKALQDNNIKGAKTDNLDQNNIEQVMQSFVEKL